MGVDHADLVVDVEALQLVQQGVHALEQSVDVYGIEIVRYEHDVAERSRGLRPLDLFEFVPALDVDHVGLAVATGYRPDREPASVRVEARGVSKLR